MKHVFIKQKYIWVTAEWGIKPSKYLASKELKSCLRLAHSCCQQSGLSREALGCLDKTNWQQAPGSLGWARVGKRIQTLQRSSWIAANRSSLFHVFTLIQSQIYPRLYPVRATRNIFTQLSNGKELVPYCSVPASSATQHPPGLAAQVSKRYQKFTQGVIKTLELWTNMPANKNQDCPAYSVYWTYKACAMTVGDT